MDKKFGKRHLHEGTSSSYDIEHLVSPAKQPKISSEAISTDVIVTVLPPGKASTSKEYLVSPSKQSKIYIERVPSEITATVLPLEEASTSKEYLVSPSKQANISIERPSEITATALTPEEASTSKENLVPPSKQPSISITPIPFEITIIALPPKEDSASESTESEFNLVSKTEKNCGGALATDASNFETDMEYEDKFAKRIPDSPKSTKNELEGFSSKYASTTKAGSSSIMQDYGVVWGDVIKTPKPIPEISSAQALKEEYMTKYARICSRELVFAVDVVYLVRLLNGLEARAIGYVTSGDTPTSPCDDAMNEALKILWEHTKNKNGPIIENHIKNAGINYTRFQKIMLQLAEATEEKRYNTARLLKYCVTVAHWAVCAERNGVPKAVEFAPLVICRTFQNLRDAGKITSTFWELMAQKAESINNKTDKQ